MFVVTSICLSRVCHSLCLSVKGMWWYPQKRRHHVKTKIHQSHYIVVWILSKQVLFNNAFFCFSFSVLKTNPSSCRKIVTESQFRSRPTSSVILVIIIIVVITCITTLLSSLSFILGYLLIFQGVLRTAL